MKRSFLVLASLCVLPLACGNPTTGPKKKNERAVVTESGLQYEDLKVGTGPAAAAGDLVEVHYTGQLTNGKVFDSSLRRNEPFQFRLGAGDVIKGWDEGVAGMKVGGKRKLWVPPALGYGGRRMGDIPPNSELIFDVELLKINGQPAE